MAKSLSEDLRLRVIAAVEAGLSRRAAAERFGVAAASAMRWVRECRESGAAPLGASSAPFFCSDWISSLCGSRRRHPGPFGSIAITGYRPHERLMAIS